MRDSLEFLFRQRFRGHEAPVDPALWDAIQGQLAAGAPQPEAGGLEDLMRERFQGHEMHVDPALWGNISAQLGHGVAVGTATGGGLLGGYGWAAAGIGAVLLAGSALLFWPDAPAEVAENATGPREMAADPQPVPATVPEVPETVQPTEVTTGTEAPGRTDRPSMQEPFIDAAPTGTTPVERSGTSSPALIAAEPVTPMTGASGSELVERIIDDATTRVTEEVMARMATAPEPTPVAAEEDPWTAELPEATTDDLEPLMPNVFTPNGDGVNDAFKVINGHLFDRMMVKVFAVKNDRLVFSTTANEPWTGDHCEDGYYLVAVEAVTPEGRTVTKGQVVWLNREIRH